MNLESLQFREYLGDGVYIGVDNTGQVVIYTERSDGFHWIALDLPMIKKLNEYPFRVADAMRISHQK